MTTITQTTAVVLPPTTDVELEALLTAAQTAAAPLAALRPADRAKLLDAVADALDEAADQLVPVAERETRLPEARLRGELKRTTFQLRLFGEELRDGGYLDARIDHADADWPMGAPDRSCGACSCPWGRWWCSPPATSPSRSPLPAETPPRRLPRAAPCYSKPTPAIPGCPGSRRKSSSRHSARQARRGDCALIAGTAAGAAALRDPRIKAGAFTGSIPGGRALFDIANSPARTHPFLRGTGQQQPGLRHRGRGRRTRRGNRRGFVSSFTLGAGQFCTKPETCWFQPGSGMAEASRADCRRPRPAQRTDPVRIDRRAARPAI